MHVMRITLYAAFEDAEGHTLWGVAHNLIEHVRENLGGVIVYTNEEASEVGAPDIDREAEDADDLEDAWRDRAYEELVKLERWEDPVQIVIEPPCRCNKSGGLTTTDESD